MVARNVQPEDNLHTDAERSGSLQQVQDIKHMPLIRLIYTSTAKHECDDAELDDILAVSARNNAGRAPDRSDRLTG